MRLHRFYIKEKIDSPASNALRSNAGREKEIEISNPEIIHQWKNVFRFGAGDKVILFDGNGIDFVCEIISIDKKESRLSVVEKIENKFEPKKKISLYFSLIKKNNMELILEKCTELGVSEFHPVISERSDPNKFLSEQKLERARKIITEASEQSGRGELPTIHEPVFLSEVLKNFSGDGIVFDPSGLNFEVSSYEFQVLSLFVGPEGGWTESELEMFHQKGIQVFSLGKQILRAETAGIVSSAMMLL